MTLRPYPVYKASGASWLGFVPDEWAVVPAKTLFVERRETNRADDEHLTPSQKYGVLPQSEYMSTTGNKVVLNLSGADAMRHVEPRDFISHLRSFQGGLELSMLKGKVSAAYTVLQPRNSTVARFFKHLFKSTMYVQALQTTTDQLRDGQSIRYAQFARISLCLPSEVEQTQIADYLDAHTAKIDALIGKQERLIETLAERRHAVISHAVTKGLEPNAPMKDSGIEWLGSVPEQWSVGALKRYGRLSTGSTPSTDIPQNFDAVAGLPWIRPQDIDPKVRGAMASLYLSSVGMETVTTVAPGSVLVVSTAWSISKIGYTSAPCATNQQITAIQSPECGAYLYFLLQAAKDEILASMVLNRLPIIGNARLGSIQLPIPPLDEQRSIAEHLEASMAQIDALSAKAREMIDVLKERRQALISAAVTGKIDVRGLS